jgi:hypothetical protein
MTALADYLSSEYGSTFALGRSTCFWYMQVLSVQFASISQLSL